MLDFIPGQDQSTAVQSLNDVLAIYDEAPVGLTVVGLDFRFKRINRMLAELNGVPAEQHIGRTIRDVVPRIADAVEGIIARVAETGAAIRNIDVEAETRANLGARKFVAHFSPLKAADGSVTAVNVVVEDVTTQKHVQQLLLESEQRTAAALRIGNIGVFERTLRPLSPLYWDKTTRMMWGIGEAEPITDELFLKSIHPDDVAAVLAFRQQIYKSVSPLRMDAEYRIYRLSDHALRWIAICIDILFDSEGPVKLIGTAQDITDRKMAEERANLMMREINHRSKNLLTVVQAIASQTMKNRDAGISREFSERLISLSSTYDLIVHNQWSGVDFRELLISQLAHFKSLVGHRIHLSGPSLFLSAKAAQDLGMALHELATNSAKYGALSSEAGQLSISWNISKCDIQRDFTLTWTEEGGPSVTEPMHSGFGTLVTGRLLQNSFNADVTAEYATTGLRWNFKAPVSAVSSKAV